MTLDIQTFSNLHGGSSFFKATGHPLAALKAHALIAHLEKSGPVAIYDPYTQAASFAEFYDLGKVDLRHVYIQELRDLGSTMLGCRTEPITDLVSSGAQTLFVTAFDATQLIENIRHLLPDNISVTSLDEIRLGNEFLTKPSQYLHSLNFSTNIAFFRDMEGHHTRLTTINYWSGYGSHDTKIWFCLFDEDGTVLAQWLEDLANSAVSIVIDSAEVRERFRLNPFTGQLFMHVISAAGHDIVKYALDTYGNDNMVYSCTHDANAWPADRYAGLPAPADGEKVILWVQNSHPCPIPRGAVGINRMGHDDVVTLDKEVAPFATFPLDIATLLPNVKWPEQIEIHAGKHFVRPRYEIETEAGHIRIAHPNVERIDLEPDPHIPELSKFMGKSYLLPAPVLPIKLFSSVALPTPMSTVQTSLPLAFAVYDASGEEVMWKSLGCLPRDHALLLKVDDMLNDKPSGILSSGYGHMELIYDFREGGEADGWLHGLFRYEDRKCGHAAETSFGAHIFNTVLTYRNEPQSYGGRAPGLSTRLFLRVGSSPADTMCHLIYPASTPWHKKSNTDLILYNAQGDEIVCKTVTIPCGGSLLWRYSEMFSEAERNDAGEHAYLIVREVTCRLFGYHGLIGSNTAFSLDHMFGF